MMSFTGTYRLLVAAGAATIALATAGSGAFESTPKAADADAERESALPADDGSGEDAADVAQQLTATDAPWFACGTLLDMNDCQMPGYPVYEYEYGVVANTHEPNVVNCTYWNVGIRIYNRHPYMVNSDNPSTGMNWGGFIAYKGTNADDDDVCSPGWRHKYWYMGPSGTVVTNWSLGCWGGTTPVYCRKR